MNQLITTMRTKALTVDDLIFEIHKASPTISVYTLRTLNEETLLKIYQWACTPDHSVKIVRDERMYDNKGNVVPEETVDEEPDVLEPYDMEYLKDKSGKQFSQFHHPVELSRIASFRGAEKRYHFTVHFKRICTYPHTT